MSKLQSKVLSTRVPVDVFDLVQRTADKNGTTVSMYISEVLTADGHPVERFARGGQTAGRIPTDLSTILVAAGGFAIGSLIYRAVYVNLPETYTEKRKRLIAYLAALAGAGIAVYSFRRVLVSTNP